jgi:hypothetical protein
LEKLRDWKEYIVQDRAPDYRLIRIGDDCAAVKRRRKGRNLGRLGKVGPQSSQMLGELRRGMRPWSTESEDIDAYWLDLNVAKVTIVQYKALGLGTRRASWLLFTFKKRMRSVDPPGPEKGPL